MNHEVFYNHPVGGIQPFKLLVGGYWGSKLPPRGPLWLSSFTYCLKIIVSFLVFSRELISFVVANNEIVTNVAISV